MTFVIVRGPKRSPPQKGQPAKRLVKTTWTQVIDAMPQPNERDA